jgi:UDP-glucose 6-dehydrogenase
MCFPKDIKALSGYMEEIESINGVLKGVIEERDRLRSD